MNPGARAENKSDAVIPADPFASPAKGILLTPGTTATRRKTVSFGGLAAKVETSEADNLETQALVSSISRGEPSDKVKEDLRRSLFRAKTGTGQSIVESDAQTTQYTQVQLSTKAEDTCSKEEDPSKHSSDMTVDLKSPRSKSGQHWKREYQREHDKSKFEMRKLIRYSQLTKSYAVQRDGDAIRLAEKLKSAEATVQEMESRVSKLASQLMDAQDQGDKQQEVLNELATQTAQALRYKQKAEKYRHALLDQDPRDLADHRQILPTPEISGIEQPEVSSLRTEVSSLRAISKKAEERALKLERENDALKHTLARVKEEMKRYETRHRAREEARKRKDEKSAAQKRNLKEQLASMKAENKRLLGGAKPHSGQSNLTENQPLITKNRAPSTAQQDAAIDGLRSRQANSNPVGHGNPAAGATSSKAGFDLGDQPGKTENEETQCDTEYFDPTKAERESHVHIDSSSQQQANRRMTNIHNKNSLQNGSDLWAPSTNGSPDTRKPPTDLEFAGVLNPLNQNSSHIPQDGNEAIKSASLEGQVRLSPQIVGGRNSRPIPSSRVSSMVRRTPLPPDRAAAAKRRLEQRSAERSKSREYGKENRKPVS